ncbi:aminopeptidase N [Dermacoccus nishinomiyaensis]|uniref:aminopeptidase N n=1 Tax=Dermacoccus nishinomiyaensis TaxID=1274 RepID=UPI0011A84DFE|nr:aminopeptidase N [Dermacoccus nishinomiyaensis]
MTLTRDEAQARAAIVHPTAYRIDLDLDAGPRTFGSTTTLTFDAQAGASTFVDLDPDELLSASLNGRDLDVTTALDGRRLRLDDLAERNELVVTARMTYGRDGQGLHRATDPADSNDYVYGHLFMDAASRVYACFDQPDLKAPYDVTVRAPQGWTVVANGAMREVEPQLWRAATTKPLATYFVTVCAGPFATVTAEHDGIPLALHARASLRDRLEAQADEMLTVTRESFDYYHQLFGIRYPFGEYHQVFVPEFNAGAMENPGCVTFRDQLVFTGAASRTEHLSRANTISHEMAHMWFGDLVTMQWWDDLWLNESFAEYMANRTLVAATEFDDAWVDVAAGRKAWGYAAERSPSTHPVAGAPAPDTDTALQNFDGISYAKGSAVLRQLIHHIGDDAFIAGVRLHLQRHAFANATLADFLASLEEASGTDLTRWAAAWLETAGMDTLRVDGFVGAARGVVTEGADDAARTTRSLDDARDPAASAPSDHDASATADTTSAPHLVIEANTQWPAERTHTLRVSAHSADGALVAVDDLTGAAGRVDLPEVSGAMARGEQVAAIIPNAGDLTWAGVEFDAATLAALPTALPGIADATTRGMIWTALAHGLATAVVSPQQVLAIAEGALPAETQMPVLDVAVGVALGQVVGRFMPWSERSDAAARLAAVGEQLMAAASDSSTSTMSAASSTSTASPSSSAAGASSLSPAVAPSSTSAGASSAARVDAVDDPRLLAGARLVASTGDAERLRPWFAGEGLPAGLDGDAPFRWRVARRLAQLDAVTIAELGDALAADETMSGQLGYLTARASFPTAEAKAWAWEELTAAPTDDTPAHSNYEMNALATGFWSADDEATLAPYIERYVSDVPAMHAWVGEDALARVASLAFPTALASEELDVEARRMLERDLPASVRRAVVDQQALVREVLASRAAFVEG